MKTPDKRHFFKTLPILLFLSGILAAFYLYFANHNSKIFFSFKSRGPIVKNVTEIGELRFAPEKRLNLKNIYQIKEEAVVKDSLIQLNGKIDGKIDDVLKPLIKSDEYFFEIDWEKGDFCPRNFVPHYPIALRRFIYFMPRSELFNGKKWEISACDGNFICAYSLILEEGERTVDLNCSGKIENNDVVLAGKLEINGAFDGFPRTDLEIISENSDLLSSWNFKEESLLN